MKEALASLKRQRLQMMLLNLAYFLLLLVAGAMIFLRGIGPAGYGLAAGCLILYLLLVRPVSRKYTDRVRGEVLRFGSCAELEDFSHHPRQGLDREKLQDIPLVAQTGSQVFMSREYLTGSAGPIAAELADVTFPIWENGRNAMFSGSCIRLYVPGGNLPEISVESGDLAGLDLPAEPMKALERMNELIPGSLNLYAGGSTVTVLLRGRFLAFPVNPLSNITDKTLRSDMYPELKEALRLARWLNRKRT